MLLNTAFHNDLNAPSCMYFINLLSTRDLNPKVTADGQCSFPFKCPLFHPLILSSVFHALLKIKT